MKKPKDGKTQRYLVVSNATGLPILVGDSVRAYVRAFTPKSAKHQARQAFGDVRVERAVT